MHLYSSCDFCNICLSDIDITIIIPVVIIAVIILSCVIYHIAEYYYRRRRRLSSLIRSGGGDDIRVMEYLTASPPEYNDALNMRSSVQTISGSRNLNEREQQPQLPPSYGTATSGLFQLTLPDGCPTPPRAATPTPDTRNSHGDREVEHTRQGYPCSGQHNPAFVPDEQPNPCPGRLNPASISDEDCHIPSTPPPNYDNFVIEQETMPN